MLIYDAQEDLYCERIKIEIEDDVIVDYSIVKMSERRLAIIVARKNTTVTIRVVSEDIFNHENIKQQLDEQRERNFLNQ